jgi:hypothetical protein
VLYFDLYNIRAGIRENIRSVGLDCLEIIHAMSGERCSPQPRNFTAWRIRLDAQALFDNILPTIGDRFGTNEILPASNTARPDEFERLAATRHGSIAQPSPLRRNGLMALYS